MAITRVDDWKALGLSLSLFTPGIGVLVTREGTAHAAGKPTSNQRLTSLSADDLGGKPVALSAYEGKALLVVNTASECGYTPQYKGLEELHNKYKARGLAVLGFPSNDFGGQEPGSNAEIKKFCELRYKVTFPMFGKVAVKGPAKHAVYKFLSETQPNAATRQEPKWNFAKYLISPTGEVVGFFSSDVEPMSPELAKEIEKVLPTKG